MTNTSNAKRITTAKKPPAEDLHLEPFDPKRHMDEVVDLGGHCFADRGDFFTARKRYRERLGDTSGWFNPAVSRVGLLDGRIVSFVGICDYLMRVGKARLRTAGVGMVCTHGDYRKRGLVSRTMDAVLAACAADGFDVSVLFGIPNFYSRFGYTRAWSETIWTVELDELPQEEPPVALQKGPQHLLGDLARLYDRENNLLTGTAVHPARKPLPGSHGFLSHTWADSRGRLAGFVMSQPKGDTLNWICSAGDVEQALRVLAHEARRSLCRRVRFEHLHHDHPLCLRIRQGNCRAETVYARDGRAMIRTVNLASTLEKMVPEFEQRLAASSFISWSGDLLLADPREKAMLKIRKGRVSIASPTKTPHAIRGGDALAQLLIGTDEPTDVVQSHGMKLSGETKGLVPALFPERHPTLNTLDRY
ncbi:GNAT family N-acetyltransferase [bacterium]|nr:GNAT family N-acetyltransferase [bacterium]